jgi:acetyltransferase-like isoleucine patch superfamily enzyme
VVERYCFFGVNATLRDGLHFGEGTLVAMGACVTRDTEAWGVYTGVPAKKSNVSSKKVNI